MALRVFELAKELNTPTKDLILVIQNIGIEVKNNFSTLSDDQIKTIKKKVQEPAARPKTAAQSAPTGLPKVRRRIISVKKVESKQADAPEEEVEQQQEKVDSTVGDLNSEVSDQDKKTPKITLRKKVISVKDQDQDQDQDKAQEAKDQDPVAPEKDLKDKETTESAPKTQKKDSTKDSEKPKEAADAKPEKVKKKGKGKGVEVVENELEKPPKDKAPGFGKKDKFGRKSGKIGKKVVVIEDELEEETAEPVPAAKKERFVFDSKKKKGPIFKKKGGRWLKKGGFEEEKEAKHQFEPRKKDLVVGEFITVGDLASLIGIKVSEIIKTLMSLDVMATITQSIDGETAALVANEHDIELKVEHKSIEEEIEFDADKEEDLVHRPPVVTIMGHVDHGKTSLLDKIRKTNVTDDEAGGITQHIGAYQVQTKEGSITFLDTPGHEAFTAMRARGANVTDIVILVVAADDGPRPQTREAIDHARAAEVPIIVAVNKCDKPDANPDKTVQQLMDLGLVPEEFGGETPMIQVSAHTGEGIPKLLEMLHLQSEIMELKANPDRFCEGVVIESKVDKGRGNSSTILVQKGTLKIGDCYVVGSEFGRVRAMWDDKGKTLETATPSTPVEIVGLNGLPRSGDPFNVGKDEKQVRQIASLRTERDREKNQQKQPKVSLSSLFSEKGTIEKSELNLIIKADVIGSMEALCDSLNGLGNEEVSVRIIHSAVGAITKTDTVLAQACDGIILGFNTRPDASAKKHSQEENIEIRLYSVIYEALEDIKTALEGMLSPIVREEIQGKAEVLEVFTIPKVGTIAGSKVIEGKIVRDSPVRVIRDNVIIFDGKLASLKRFKDNAKEVTEGFECGIGVTSYKDIRVGDILESYQRMESQAKL